MTTYPSFVVTGSATPQPPPAQRLILTVGLPRSGKSTWAARMRVERGWVVVETDAIRLSLLGQRFFGPAEPMIWAITQTMVRALFRAGHDTIILDATSTFRDRRSFWRSPEWKLCFKIFDTSREICLERARGSPNADLHAVIEKMASSFEPVQPDEGDILPD